MSKRFTSTGKWLDSWFCELGPMDKLFWIYILDNCDACGLWDVNIPLVKFHLGNYEPKIETFGGKIISVAHGKWFVPAFISYQYGELKQECRPHAHVLSMLKKHDLKGYLKGIGTLKDKNKDKDKDKDKDSVRFTPPTFDEVSAYCLERKNGIDPNHFIDHYEARGWVPKGYTKQMKDWRATVRTWEKNNIKPKAQEQKTREQVIAKLLEESKNS